MLNIFCSNFHPENHLSGFSFTKTLVKKNFILMHFDGFESMISSHRYLSNVWYHFALCNSLCLMKSFIVLFSVSQKLHFHLHSQSNETEKAAQWQNINFHLILDFQLKFITSNKFEAQNFSICFFDSNVGKSFSFDVRCSRCRTFKVSGEKYNRQSFVFAFQICYTFIKELRIL